MALVRIQPKPPGGWILSRLTPGLPTPEPHCGAVSGHDLGNGHFSAFFQGSLLCCLVSDF